MDIAVLFLLIVVFAVALALFPRWYVDRQLKAVDRRQVVREARAREEVLARMAPPFRQIPAQRPASSVSSSSHVADNSVSDAILLSALSSAHAVESHHDCSDWSGSSSGFDNASSSCDSGSFSSGGD